MRRLFAALAVALLGGNALAQPPAQPPAPAQSQPQAPAQPQLPASSQAAAEVPPFDATFAIVWKGISAGSNEMHLQRNPEGGYIYTSRARAAGFFRAFFHEDIRQTSWMTVDAQGVHPQRYVADDGTRDTKRDITLEFDWKTLRATGVAEDKPVDVPLLPGVQDAMSIQIAHMTDLLRGAKITSYSMVDKNAIKEYVYTYEGPARIKTSIGELDTVVWRLQRPNNSRVTRAWHALSLNYLPVRAERLRDGDREWLMEIRSVRR
jgi:hypothetical protein